MPTAFAAGAIAAAAVALSSSILLPQLPPGHFALATAQQLQPIPGWAGPAGVYIGHPRHPGAMRAITGLPPSLRVPSGGVWWGASAVALHEPSGDLLLGDFAAGPTGQVTLYRVTIDTQTLAAVSVVPFVLGFGTDGDCNQIAVLPGNRVLVACNNTSGAVGTGPMALAEVDLATGGITPWPVSSQFSQPFTGQAICVDAATDSAFVGGGPGGSFTADIYRVPLSTPTTRQWVASVPLFLDNLQFDASKRTIVASGRANAASTGAIFRVDPNVAPATVVLELSNWRNAPTVAVEPATGDLLYGGVQLPGSTTVGVWHLPGGGMPTFLTNTALIGAPPTATAPAAPLGLAIAPAPSYFGTATSTQPVPGAAWRRGRLPGGLPLVGNGTFALALDVPVGATLSQAWWFASLGQGTGAPPALGLAAWIDLAPGVFLRGGDFTGPSSSHTIPIPNLPSLAGARFFVQALTVVDYGAPGLVLGASDGACITVL